MTNGDMDRRDDQELDLLVENVVRILEQEDAKIYSREVIEEFRHPANIERMGDANGSGVGDGICGDSMEIYIKVRDGRIERCTFFTDGCGATIACGSRLTRMATGMSLDEAMEIKPVDLISALKGLPEEHVHCASLTVLALRNAVRDHRHKKGRS